MIARTERYLRGIYGRTNQQVWGNPGGEWPMAGVDEQRKAVLWVAAEGLLLGQIRNNDRVEAATDALGSLLYFDGAFPADPGAFGEESAPVDYRGHATERYAYAGLEALPDVPKYQMARQRLYDSSVGRFTSIDAVRSENWFSYGNSDPMGFVDPEGLFGRHIATFTAQVPGSMGIWGLGSTGGSSCHSINCTAPMVNEAVNALGNRIYDNSGKEIGRGHGYEMRLAAKVEFDAAMQGFSELVESHGGTENWLAQAEGENPGPSISDWDVAVGINERGTSVATLTPPGQPNTSGGTPGGGTSGGGTPDLGNFVSGSRGAMGRIVEGQPGLAGALAARGTRIAEAGVLGAGGEGLAYAGEAFEGTLGLFNLLTAPSSTLYAHNSRLLDYLTQQRTAASDWLFQAGYRRDAAAAVFGGAVTLGVMSTLDAVASPPGVGGEANALRRGAEAGAEALSRSASRGLAEGETWVYRGVHAGHPPIGAARQGRVVPGNIAGTATEEAHNLGGVAADSPFTSWTHNPDVAAFHAAKEGPGGVTLRVPTGAPPPGATWSWTWSPDVYGESEVLLRGVREGAEVITP